MVGILHRCLVRPTVLLASRLLLLLPARMSTAQEPQVSSEPRASTATTDERSAIVATIQHYFRAGDTGSSAELRAGFHPMAMMYSVTPTGEVAAVTQTTWQQRLEANRAPVAATERRIDWIRNAGTGAAAKLTSTFATFQFIDYVELRKTNGRWQIVGKIFHRREPIDAALNAEASDRIAIEALLAPPTADKLRIVHLDISGTAAFAEIARDAGTGSVVDYALVLRTADGWRTFNPSTVPKP